VEYRTLGGTGLQVGVFSLGAMMFGRGANADHAECLRILELAFDAGVNLVDTSDAYSFGESEEIVGKALRGRRSQILVATKLYFAMSRRDPNRAGGSRRWIAQACEDSMRRLGTDWIDLYQLHRIDPRTDPEEMLGALSDLVRQGKVRAIGTSGARAEQLVELQWTAERCALERPRSEQPPYSILTRGIERDVLPSCARFGIGALVYSPLNQGWLAGRYRREQPPPPDSRAARGFVDARYWDRARADVRDKLERVEKLDVLARSAGLSLLQLALGFAIEHPAVSSAILGPRTLEQARELLAAVDVRLASDVLDAIDRIVAPGSDVDDANWRPVNPALGEPAGRRRLRG
jgi:aryl-alcohol dehydrogenase-like predicted oxidoreductase